MFNKKNKDEKSNQLSEKTDEVGDLETEKNVPAEVETDTQEKEPEVQEAVAVAVVPEKPESSGSGGGMVFFKFVISLILLGVAGLGLFWGYGKIKEGEVAFHAISELGSKVSKFQSNQEEMSQSISDLNSKVSSFDSNQKELIGIIDSLGARISKVSESNKLIEAKIPETKIIFAGVESSHRKTQAIVAKLEANQTEIIKTLQGIGAVINKIVQANEKSAMELPETLSAFDKRLSSLDEVVSDIPKTIIASIEKNKLSPADIEFKIQARPPSLVALPEIAIHRERDITVTPVNALEKFMKTLFINVRQGINWSIESVGPALSKIKGRIKTESERFNLGDWNLFEV